MTEPRDPDGPASESPWGVGDSTLGATPDKTRDPGREIRLLEGRGGSERDPEGRAFAPLADAYRRAGRLADAARVVEEGVERLPDFVTGHVVAGLVHRDRGDTVSARRALDRALELDPANRTALRTLAEMRLEEGDSETARGLLGRLEEVGGDTGDLMAHLGSVEPASEPPEGGAGPEDPPSESPPDEELRFDPSALDDLLAGTGRAFDDSVGDTDAEGIVGPGSSSPPAGPEGDFVLSEDLPPVDPGESGPDPAGRDAGSHEHEWGVEPVVPPESRESSEGQRSPNEPLDLEFPEGGFGDGSSFEGEEIREEEAAGVDSGSTGAETPDGVVTRTMGDLYAAQGYLEEAVYVYERLVEQEPDDPDLVRRLEELRARVDPASGESDLSGGGRPEPDPEPLEPASRPTDEVERDEAQLAPQWVEEPARDEAEGEPSPFAWVEDGEGESDDASNEPWVSAEGVSAEETVETGAEDPDPMDRATDRTARQYFDDLLAWVPGAVPIESLAPDPSGAPERSSLEHSSPEAHHAEGDREDPTPGTSAGDLDDFHSWIGRLGP